MSSSILVIQTAFVGDVVLTTPLLRELRRVRPRDTISVLTNENGKHLLRGLPFVDELLVFGKRWNLRETSTYVSTLMNLRRRSFDVAIAAHRSFRSGVLCRVSGADFRVGFAGAPGAWAYGQKVKWDPSSHAIERYLDLSQSVGGERARADKQPVLAVDPSAAEQVDALLGKAGDPLVCIAPGSNRTTKRWLPRGFAEVAAEVAERGLRPILIGAPRELELCREVSRLSRVKAEVMAGKIGIPELVALVARSRALVANDSGPSHIASALNVPVVSIFGPTAATAGYAAFGVNSRIVENHDLSCRPCSARGPKSCPEGHFRCMGDIEAGAVMAVLDELTGEAAPRRIVACGQGALSVTFRPG